MPLSYGGGIKSIDHVEKILRSGVEKIILNTAAFQNPQLIRDISKRFGSQSVVVSVDIKKRWLGNYSCYSYETKRFYPGRISDHLDTFVEAGAGELLINSVDNDGTRGGIECGVLDLAKKNYGIPVSYAGGVSSIQDLKLVADNGLSGVAVGAFFVYYGPHKAVLVNYPTQEELQNIFGGRR